MYLHIPLIHTSPQWLATYSGLLHCRIAATAMLTINLPTAVEMHVCCKGNSKLTLLWNSERMGKGNWIPTASEYLPRLLTPLSLSIPTSTLDSGSTEFKFKCNLNWDCHWLPSCWGQGQLELALKFLRLGEVVSPPHPCSCSLEIPLHPSFFYLPFANVATSMQGRPDHHPPWLTLTQAWPNQLNLGLPLTGWSQLFVFRSPLFMHRWPLVFEALLQYMTNIWVKDLCLPS